MITILDLREKCETSGADLFGSVLKKNRHRSDGRDSLTERASERASERTRLTRPVLFLALKL